jgi:hypothetical protein
LINIEEPLFSTISSLNRSILNRFGGANIRKKGTLSRNSMKRMPVEKGEIGNFFFLDPGPFGKMGKVIPSKWRNESSLP